MTEEEAKTKWCPFAMAQMSLRQVGTKNFVGVATYNRGEEVNTVHQNSLCLGSRCMAWRERGDSDVSHGYCGLAGKP